MPFDLEQSHGKARITRPRLSDVNDGTAAERRAQRDANGRAARGNTLASGRGWKRALATTLPDTVEARKLYAAAVRELVHDTPFARAACARWTVHTLRCAELAAEATKAGVATKAGAELDARSREHAELAERAAVAACTFTKRKSPGRSAPSPATKTDELRARVMGGTE